MDEFERLLRVDEVLIHCIKCLDLVLGEEVSHHVVQEAHSRRLKVATKRPEESKGEEGTQRSHPDLLARLLQDNQVLGNEILKNAAQVNDELDGHALQRLVLLVLLELGECLIDV